MTDFTCEEYTFEDLTEATSFTEAVSQFDFEDAGGAVTFADTMTDVIFECV